MIIYNLAVRPFLLRLFACNHRAPFAVKTTKCTVATYMCISTFWISCDLDLSDMISFQNCDTIGTLYLVISGQVGTIFAHRLYENNMIGWTSRLLCHIFSFFSQITLAYPKCSHMYGQFFTWRKDTCLLKNLWLIIFLMYVMILKNHLI